MCVGECLIRSWFWSRSMSRIQRSQQKRLDPRLHTGINMGFSSDWSTETSGDTGEEWLRDLVIVGLHFYSHTLTTVTICPTVPFMSPKSTRALWIRGHNSSIWIEDTLLKAMEGDSRLLGYLHKFWSVPSPLTHTPTPHTPHTTHTHSCGSHGDTV